MTRPVRDVAPIPRRCWWPDVSAALEAAIKAGARVDLLAGRDQRDAVVMIVAPRDRLAHVLAAIGGAT